VDKLLTVAEDEAAGDAEEVHEDDDGTSDAELVAEVGGNEDERGGDDVRRRGEELRFLDGETDSSEDDRKEVGDSVRRERCGEEEHGERPELDVGDSVNEALPGHLLKLGVSSVLLDSLEDESCLLRAEKGGFVREVDDEEEGDGSEHDGDDAFDDELSSENEKR
jgi:hypothetical protein